MPGHSSSKMRAAASALFLITCGLAAADLCGATTLFPTPLHLTRQVQDPISGSTVVLNEYAYGNRLISVNYGAEQLRAWDLKETSLSAELLLDYAKYLSGRRLDSSGAMLALTPDELSELDRSLRQRAPNLFN